MLFHLRNGAALFDPPEFRAEFRQYNLMPEKSKDFVDVTYRESMLRSDLDASRLESLRSRYLEPESATDPYKDRFSGASYFSLDLMSLVHISVLQCCFCHCLIFKQ